MTDNTEQTENINNDYKSASASDSEDGQLGSLVDRIQGSYNSGAYGSVSRLGNDESSEDNEDSDEDNEEYGGIVCGIDLGTTNSCISIWKNDTAIIIPDEHGNKSMPSVVGYTNLSTYVGREAKNQMELNPENVFYEVKRLIGRKKTDKDVQKELDMLSYDITEDSRGNVRLQATVRNNMQITPEEISAKILKRLRDNAERYLKCEVKDVVITVPANFNSGQRKATRDAAQIAGLNVLELIEEPTAACLAYGMKNRSEVLKKNEDGETDYLSVIVYDFGGGTLDVSLVDIYDGMFEVKSDAGNSHFGGADFDEKIMSHSIRYFKHKYGLGPIDPSPLKIQKLRKECEKAKKQLSVKTKTYIVVQDFYDGKNLIYPLTRKLFERMCEGLFVLCLHPIEQVLKDNDMTVNEIDEIILVGGMTQVPYIRELIKKRFNKNPNFSVNPGEAIAVGASIKGFMINNPQDPFLKDVGMINITSMSLGIETIGDVMDVVVPRRSIIPCKENKIYTTIKDDETCVTVKIYEGERAMTKDNFFVGEFDLEGIPPAPRGYPEIEVMFEIDGNGIINVTARNIKTDDNNCITVSSNKERLSEDEIRDIIKRCEKEEHKEQISRMKRLLRYEISDLCNTILENTDNKEFKFNDENRKLIKNDVNKILDWLETKDWDLKELKNKSESVKKKYGTLILKGTMEHANVKEHAGDDDMQRVTVHGNEEEDHEEMNILMEQVKDDDLGLLGMTDERKEEIKRLRETLNDTCDTCMKMITDSHVLLKDEDREHLMIVLNEIKFWLCVAEKPKKIQYLSKIDEIDEVFNEVMQSYQDEGNDIFKKHELVEDNDDAVNELENLCLTIQIMIQNKSLPINFKTVQGVKDVKSLYKITQEIQDWVVEEIYKKDKDLTEEMKNKHCQIKLDYLNEVCDKVYRRNYHRVFVDNDVVEGSNENESENESVSVNKTENKEEDKFSGTSLVDLIEKRSKVQGRDIMSEIDNLYAISRKDGHIDENDKYVDIEEELDIEFVNNDNNKLNKYENESNEANDH